MFASVLAFMLLFSAPRSDSDALAALDRERAQLRTLHLEAVVGTPKANGRLSRFTVTFDWLAPDRYRSEVKMGVEGDLVTVADGRTIVSLATRERKATRQAQATATARLRKMGPFDPLTALATPALPLGSLYRLEETRREKNGEITLILRPQPAVPNYDRLALTLAADGRTPHRAVTTRRGQVQAELEFTIFRKNPALAAERFRIEIPAGWKIVDIP